MCNDRRLPVSQYGSNSLLKRFIDTFNDRVCESNEALSGYKNFFNINEATGEWLDLIGAIIGQPRLAYDGANSNWFAMDSLDPLQSGFGVGKFWNGQPIDDGLIILPDAVYRQLILARSLNNRASSTINDILLVILLILGRTDARILDGGCEDIGLVTPLKMQFAVEFQNPIDEDERSLLLNLDLLPRTIGVALTTVLP